MRNARLSVTTVGCYYWACRLMFYQWSDRIIKPVTRSQWRIRNGFTTKTVQMMVTPRVRVSCCCCSTLDCARVSVFCAACVPDKRQSFVFMLFQDEARRHFDCPDLEGAELEDQDSTGTAFSHWEKRVFEVRFHRMYLLTLEDGAKSTKLACTCTWCIP